MKKINSIFYAILFLLPVIFIIRIFFPWFINPQITGGDWPYYGKGMFDSFSTFASLWTNQFGGVGGVNPDFPIYGYLNFTIGFFVNLLNIPWVIIYKIFWFALPLVLGSVSIINLYKIVKKQTQIWELSLVAFLYLCNSYFLLISAGGQMGIALAYSIAPLVLGSAIRFLNNSSVKSKLQVTRSSLIFGLILAIDVFFDSRIALLICGITFLYFLFHYFFIKKISLIKILEYWFLGLITVLLLHSYWIIPFYAFKLLTLPKGLIGNSGGFSFFSFADFSHAFSLLHPNWPENIFGKVYFLQPEFLIYPFTAFSALVFIGKEPKETKAKYLFFGIIAFLGVFFSKGVQEPFGFINSWLYNFSGFNLFRDPTKYYLLIAISYSVMITFSVKKIYEIFQNNVKIQICFVIFCILIFSIPIREGLTGKLNGTFSYTPVPNEYLELSKFLSSRSNFFRTLWIPEQSSFRFASETHPMLISDNVFGSNNTLAIIKQLEKPGEEIKLQNLSIKYLVIPSDTTSQIFLTDRKYDDKKRQSLINQLDKISYLAKETVGNIILYKVPNPKDHFYFLDEPTINYKSNSSSDYSVNINTKSPQTLIFAETYNPGWIGITNGNEIKSIQTKEGFNSFALPAGNYSLQILFMPDKYQKYFYLLSCMGLVGILLFLFTTKNRR